MKTEEGGAVQRRWSSMSGTERRVVKLLCPSVSKKKIVELMVWEDQRLDFGLISRAFGLDPATLKLNKHLITKGLDLISSSITWASLLSFFESRGFPTAPLIVDGKLCKSGTKRGVDDDPCCSIISELQDINQTSKKKRGDENSLKRKLALSSENHINDLLKKQKTRPADPCISGFKRPREEQVSIYKTLSTI